MIRLLSTTTSLFLWLTMAAQAEKNLQTMSNDFTTKFNDVILQYHPMYTNLIYSPFNIEEAMYILSNAADGQSYIELSNALGLPSSPNNLSTINSKFKQYLTQLQVTQTSPNGDSLIDVQLSAGLFVESEFPIKSSYEQTVSTYYESVVKNLDFQNNRVQSTDYINDLVSQKTQGLIPQVYPTPLPANTVLVIFATLYYHSQWKNNFFRLDKTRRTFTNFNGTVEAQYINNHDATKEVGYTVLDSCQMVRISYYNSDYSLIVALPARGQDPKTFLKNLNSKKISRIFAETEKSQPVNVTIPRFKANTTFEDLIPYFQTLGVKEVFVNADLRNGINQDQVAGKLQVDSIVHKCVIDLNENGTTAAAVTSIGITTTSIPVPPDNPIQFYADHPFAVMIANTKLKIFLFLGLIYEPDYPLTPSDDDGGNPGNPPDECGTTPDGCDHGHPSCGDEEENKPYETDTWQNVAYGGYYGQPYFVYNGI